MNGSSHHGGRRPRSATAALVLVALLVAGACGDFKRFDDLEDEDVGPVAGQDGWTGSSDNEVRVDPADPNNQVLYVPSASAVLRKSLLGEDVAIPNGSARMVFMRMRIGQKQTFSVGLSPMTYPSEYSDFANELGMANSTQNLDLRAWDDDGGMYELLRPLAPDTWYNIWMFVDAASNEYQIWLNAAADGPATAADKLSAPDGDDTFEFRTGASSDLLTFYIKTSGGASGQNFGPVYFDDIYLEQTGTLNLCNPVNNCGGDCNNDGVVDLAEFVILSDCLSGPLDPVGAGCVCFDGDCDGYADLHDVAIFQRRFAPTP